MSTKFGSAVKAGLALALSGSMITAVVAPARAGDGGAIAAGILGGTALGFIAGSAAASAAPPPPPPPPGYYPPYAPAYYPPPPRCWYEPQQVWDGYEYVVRRVRVCN